MMGDSAEDLEDHRLSCTGSAEDACNCYTKTIDINQHMIPEATVKATLIPEETGLYYFQNTPLETSDSENKGLPLNPNAECKPTSEPEAVPKVKTLAARKLYPEGCLEPNFDVRVKKELEETRVKVKIEPSELKYGAPKYSEETPCDSPPVFDMNFCSPNKDSQTEIDFLEEIRARRTHLPLKKRKLTEDQELSIYIQRLKEDRECEKNSYPAQRQMCIADLQQDFPLDPRKMNPEEHNRSYNITNVYINGVKEFSTQYPMSLMIAPFPNWINRQPYAICDSFICFERCGKKCGCGGRGVKRENCDV